MENVTKKPVNILMDKDKEQQRILEGIIEREEKGYEARNILDSLKLELKYVKNRRTKI